MTQNMNLKIGMTFLILIVSTVSEAVTISCSINDAVKSQPFAGKIQMRYSESAPVKFKPCLGITKCINDSIFISLGDHNNSDSYVVINFNNESKMTVTRNHFGFYADHLAPFNSTQLTPYSGTIVSETIEGTYYLLKSEATWKLSSNGNGVSYLNSFKPTGLQYSRYVRDEITGYQDRIESTYIIKNCIEVSPW